MALLPVSIAGLALAGVIAFTPPPNPPDDTASQTVQFHSGSSGAPLTCTVHGTTGAYDEANALRIEGSTSVTGDPGCREAALRLVVEVVYDDTVARSAGPGPSTSVSVTTHSGATLGATTHAAVFFCSQDEGTLCEVDLRTHPK